MNLLTGKKGIIMGVANDKSIGWGIAEQLAKNGAELAFSYQSEILKKRVEPLAASINSRLVLECDVSKEESVEQFFSQVKSNFDTIDFIVHSIAFADKNELKGRYINTSRANFLTALDISCYSLTTVARHAEKLMTNGGSIITLSYYGAEKVIPNYNVMGIAKAALECSVKYLAADMGMNNIRVNSISSGPIRTLAASGINDFKRILEFNEDNTPLRRNVTLEDVGGVGLFLVSDLSKGVTGENIYVDAGYHVIGIPPVLAAGE